MKNLFNENFEISSRFRFKTIAKVEELMNYDMIYIYHHLKVGSEVRLSFLETRLNGDLRYEVSYANFKLGIVQLGGVTKDLYQGDEELFATISSVSKDKYLPINSLDIQLQAAQLKKVS